MVGSPWKQEMGPQKPAEVYAEQGDDDGGEGVEGTQGGSSYRNACVSNLS